MGHIVEVNFEPRINGVMVEIKWRDGKIDFRPMSWEDYGDLLRRLKNGELF
jgi:hypothetical protein